MKSEKVTKTTINQDKKNRKKENAKTTRCDFLIQLFALCPHFSYAKSNPKCTMKMKRKFVTVSLTIKKNLLQISKCFMSLFAREIVFFSISLSPFICSWHFCAKQSFFFFPFLSYPTIRIRNHYWIKQGKRAGRGRETERVKK